jgi:hypothetical protein
MKNAITYERVILTLIAGLLLLNFLEGRNQNQVVTDKLPAKFVNSSSTLKDFAIVPVNPDGSIDVKIKSMSEIMDVNIERVGGFRVTPGSLKVEIVK